MRHHVCLVIACVLGLGAGPVAVSSAADAAPPNAEAAVTWGPPTMVDPSTGNPSAISCPSASSCLVVDESGNAFTGTHGAWSTPDRVDRQARFTSVSCSSSFCEVVGYEQLAGQRYRHIALTHTDAGWSRPVTLGIVATHLSCVSSTFCLAVGDQASEVYDGQTWRPAGRVGGPYDRPSAVSCASPTFCVAALLRGDVSVFDGTSWLARTPVDPDGPLLSVSCVATTFCAAVGGHEAFVFDGGAWSAPTTVGTVHGLSSVSCVDASFCLATARGAAVRWNGTAWQDPVRTAGGVDGRPQVSCASARACVLVDPRGYSLGYDGRSWSGSELFDPEVGHLHAVSCPTATFCAAVDFEGSALTFDGSSWTQPLRIDTANLQGVSCASPTFCVAIDGAGSASTFDGSAWSTPTRIVGPHDPFLMAVACPSATFCIAMADGGTVTMYDGHQWSSQRLIGNGEFASLSCASPSYCLVTENDAEQVTWNGTSWGAQHPSGGYRLETLSCVTSTFCAGTSFVDNGIDALVYDGTHWGDPQQLSAYNAYDPLSCASTTSCQALEGSSIDYSYDGSSWSTGPRMDVHGGGIIDVSCAAGTGFCAALDRTGRILIATNAGSVRAGGR